MTVSSCLATVLTVLALAYHDAEESFGDGPAGTADTSRLQRLLRQATAARRALGDTEERHASAEPDHRRLEHGRQVRRLTGR